MSKYFKSTEEALLLRLGQMVKENVELEQRVHQLMDDYNNVCPTITICSWPCNCFLIKEYE